MHHYLSAVGYDDFQHGRYGDPNGKDTSDQRTWELAYHVEGAIRATDEQIAQRTDVMTSSRYDGLNLIYPKTIRSMEKAASS